MSTEYKNILNMRRNKILSQYSQIGKGTSRYVFDLGEYVVKNAVGGMDGKGSCQNTVEYSTYRYANALVDILCPVHDISNDGINLIMAKAVPLNKIKADNPLYLDIQRFKKILNKVKWHIHPRATLSDLSEEENLLRDDILTLIDDFELLRGDLFRLSSWGYWQDKFVLIDYGCSKDCYETYYKRKCAW